LPQFSHILCSMPIFLLLCTHFWFRCSISFSILHLTVTECICTLSDTEIEFLKYLCWSLEHD
jgi:hypothetical protein